MLFQSFLMCCHERRIVKKDLPLTLNQFYSQKVRPCRPRNSNVDVKESSFKKVKTWVLTQLGNHVTLDKTGEKITEIRLSTALLADFVPYETEDGAGGSGGETTENAAELRKLKVYDVYISEVWRVNPELVEHITKGGLLPGAYKLIGS